MEKHSAASFGGRAAAHQACLGATSASGDCGRTPTGSVLFPARLLSHTFTSHATSGSLRPGADLYGLLVSDLLASVVFGRAAPNSTYLTGIAILDPKEAGATAMVDVHDRNGSLVQTTRELVGAKRRVSKLVMQYSTDLVGQEIASGYIKVTVDRGVASFALFGTNDLSVLSAIPPQVMPWGR